LQRVLPLLLLLCCRKGNHRMTMERNLSPLNHIPVTA
jgi:hypothetical protein